MPAADHRTGTTYKDGAGERADGQICSIEGPYLDAVSALRDADARATGNHEVGIRFLVTSLWPPSGEPPPYVAP